MEVLIKVFGLVFGSNVHIIFIFVVHHWVHHIISEMADKLTDEPVVGMDLGTTNSCTGIWQNGEVMILPNKWQENTTPSCVAFTENGIVVGKSALAQKTRNPANTIFETKRTIGQNYKDIEKVIKHMPFAMTEETHPKYSVQVEGKPKLLSPAEISAIVLRQMKEDAENYLKKEVIIILYTSL